MKNRVVDVLPRGKGNAIAGPILAEQLGLRSVRQLQKVIEAERASGAVILSSTVGGGYYLPETEQEIKDFVKTLRNRAKNTFRALESAQEALLELPGQQKMG